MTDATSNDWLMHYRILRLVHQCRRLILSEFGEKLHINGAGLREQLASYAERSRSARLQRVHAELRQELIDLEGPEEPAPPEPVAPARRQRLYRGQPVHVEDPPASTGESDDTRKPRIVYRGSVA